MKMSEVVQNDLSVDKEGDSFIFKRVTKEEISPENYVRIYDGLEGDIENIKDKLNELKEQRSILDEFIKEAKELKKITSDERKKKLNELFSKDKKNKNNK